MNEQTTQNRPTVELTHKQLRTIRVVTPPGDIETEVSRVHRRVLAGEYDKADTEDTYLIDDLKLAAYEVTHLIDGLVLGGATMISSILVGYRERLPGINDVEMIPGGGQRTREWRREDVAQEYIDEPGKLEEVVETAIERTLNDWQEHRPQLLQYLRDKHDPMALSITVRRDQDGDVSLAYDVGDDREELFETKPGVSIWGDWMQGVTLHVCRIARQERGDEDE